MSPSLVNDGALTPEQTSALFDILTHHETYAEIESLKLPEAVASCGYPFVGTGNSASGSASSLASSTAQLSLDGAGGEATGPLLQAMLVQFILTLPGLKGLPREFWSVRVQTLMMRLAEADLSESYDRGGLGTRKRLAVGLGAVLERVARGLLRGLPQRKSSTGDGQCYDSGRAEDLERAWDDVLQGLVYGDLVDELFTHMSRTEDLESHSPAVEEAVDYITITLATLVHFILVDSPDGQNLLQQIEYLNGLIPYKVIKQTMRVGNAATMIGGIMRLLLAKMSIGGFTNKLGLTSNADDGMNLLQRILSLTLSWDAGDFRKSADRIAKAKAKDRPSDEVLGLVREHAAAGRAQKEAMRAASVRNSQSIVAAVLDEADPRLTASLSESQHAQCLEYYSALLAVRDREAITSVLCRQQPDVLTRAVRDVVDSYDPVIRSVHGGVDLKNHVDALQTFIGDLIRTSKPDTTGKKPGVDDYVQLLRRSRGLLFRFLHAVSTRCPDVVDGFRQWSNDSIVNFRQGGTMDSRLNDLFCSLEPSVRVSVRNAVDDHAAYLADLDAHSRECLQDLVSHGADVSPGVYLLRWKALLDETAITPGAARAPVRHGCDVRNAPAMGRTGVSDGTEDAAVTRREPGRPAAPDVDVVVQALGKGFCAVVREVTREFVSCTGE